MERLFGSDSILFKVLEKIADFVILNLLWAICCIPVVTIGASTTALYYVMLKMVRNEESHVAKMFFKAFKQNLKQGSILTIVFIAAGLLLYVDIKHIFTWQTDVKTLLLGIFVGIIVAVLVIILYTFPLLAQFENTIANTMKNAFMMGIANWPCTIVILVLNSIPIIVLVLVPYIFYAMLPFWILFGIAAISFVNSKMLKNIFEKYM